MNFPVRVKIERKPPEFDIAHPHLTYYCLAVRRQDGKASSAVFTVDEDRWKEYCETTPGADREKLLMDMFSEKLEEIWNVKVPEDAAGRIIVPR